MNSEPQNTVTGISQLETGRSGLLYSLLNSTTEYGKMNVGKDVNAMARTAYKPPVKKESGSSFDPYRPLTKAEWEKKIADAEADARNGRVHNGFDVYVEMKEKYGL